jgi:hypothetical protein
LDRVFLRQQLKFQGINLDNGNGGKPSKGTLQEILANPDDGKHFRHSLCNQSHSKAKERRPLS